MAKLYKYRELGFSPSLTYRRTKDIFVNSRLFMAQYFNMNDPMEAFYNANRLLEDEIRNIRADKTKLRICSLSKTYSDVLMWAHYGGSHKGVCIEVEVDDRDATEMEVHYRSQLWTPQTIYPNIAEDIMSHKFIPWQYEDEVRFIRKLNGRENDPQFLNIHITKVYLGCALSDDDRQKYERRINSWLSNNNHPLVPIYKLEQDDLTYWNGNDRPPLL